MGRTAAFVLLAICAVATRAQAAWHSEFADKMGTRMEVRVWHEDPAEAERLIAAGMAEFDRIEAGMSTYRDDSEISRVNARAAAAPVAVSAELYELVRRSLEISVLSGGAFDITFDSVGRFYDFRRRVQPSDAQVREHLAQIDYRHVVLDPSARTIRFTETGTRINLGGIAKGHAVERVVALLRARGVRHALATAGGDTRLLGDRRGEPWVIGIRDPDDAGKLVTRLALDDEAISTSGDYERFFDDGETRVHHILDPRTGRSATGIRSVTVVGPDAVMTEGLTKTIFIKGAEEGMRVLESVGGYEAVVVDSGRRVFLSKGLKDLRTSQ